MDDETLQGDVTMAGELVRRQRALVVTLAKAKRFEELPAAHQVLRQLEDALKLARAMRASAAALPAGGAEIPPGRPAAE